MLLSKLLPTTAITLIALLCWNGEARSTQTDVLPTSPLAERINDDLATSLADLESQNAALREQLREESRHINALGVTSAMLEEARLFLDVRQKQVETLQSQQRRLDSNISQQESALALAQQNLNGLGSPTSTDEEAQLARTQAQVMQLNADIDAMRLAATGLRQTINLNLQTVALARERLELLQSRFTLVSIVQEQSNDAMQNRLSQMIEQSMDQARGLRERMAVLTGSDPDSVNQRQLLEVQLQAADSAVSLLAMRLSLERIEHVLRGVQSLIDSQSIPVTTLRDASQRLKGLSRNLDAELEANTREHMLIDNLLRLIEQRSPAIEGSNSTQPEQLRILRQINDELNEVRTQIESIRQRGEQLQEYLQDAISTSAQRELFSFRPPLNDLQSLHRLLDGLERLPHAFFLSLSNEWNTLQSSWQRSSINQRAWIAESIVALLLLVIIVHRLLYIRLVRPNQRSNLALMVRAVRRNLPWFFLPGALLLITALLDQDAPFLILSLLLLPALIKLVFDLTWMTLVLRTTGALRQQRLRLYDALRRVMLLFALQILLIITVHKVDVTPLVKDALERSALLLLLLMVWPSLHLRRLILSLVPPKERRPLLRLIATLSLLVPLALTGSALLGLIGYVNLGASISSHLGWSTSVVLAWLATYGVLQDAIRSLKTLLRQRTRRPELWIRQFVAPLHLAMALALIAAAGLLLAHVLDWRTNTPPLVWLIAILEQPLLSLQDGPLRVMDILMMLVLVTAVFWLSQWFQQISNQLLFVQVRDSGVRQSLSTFIQYAIVVLGGLITLSAIGINLTALTVLIGALSVGIGFGLQNIANNFVSGLLLLAERPLKVGDVVLVDGYEGEVTTLGIRSLTVKTWDNHHVIIPNSSVISQSFTNLTRTTDIVRTVLMVRISYDDEPTQAMSLVSDILRQQDGIVANPAPAVLLWDFADSAIMLRVQYYVHMNGVIGPLGARSAVMLKIWNTFNEHGIRIPYPQRDLHVYSMGPVGQAEITTSETGIAPSPQIPRGPEPAEEI